MPDEIHCSHEGCEASVKNNRWAKIRADDWCFFKNGDAFCPNHTPAWVGKWREGKKKS